MKTAVEWLFDNLNITGGSDDMKAFEKAKEMEKEQMKEMYLKGIENYDPTFKRKDNETFKSE